METTSTYRQARDYLESLPRAKLTSKNAITLARIHSALAEIKNPQNEFRSIHIAGTSGKGSVVSLLASVLTQAGHKTGSFYSPYLESPRESIQIDNKVISQKSFLELFVKLKPLIEKFRLTHFEAKTLAAFVHFANQKVDFGVVETGLGGRLDASNVITPIVSVITTVDFDHTEVLGKTLQKIAREKAGIIKTEIPVVTAVKNYQTLEVIKQIAKTKNSQVIVVKQSKLFHKTNEAIAKKVISVLRIQGIKIPRNSFDKGLKRAFIPGRFEVVGDIILDGAHNVEKTRAFCARFRHDFPSQKAVVIFGSLKTKNSQAMLKILQPIARKIITTQVKNSPHQFAKAQFDDEKKALGFAKTLRKSDEKIIITGSLYLVGALRHVVLQRPKIS